SSTASRASTARASSTSSSSPHDLTPGGVRSQTMTIAPRSEPRHYESVDDVVAALRADGLRLSMPRRQVLEALFAADALVSAEYIAAGTDTGVAIELTSVYRNLEQLEELGE